MKDDRTYKRKNGEALSRRPHILRIVTRAGWRRALEWFRHGTTRRITHSILLLGVAVACNGGACDVCQPAAPHPIYTDPKGNTVYEFEDGSFNKHYYVVSPNGGVTTMADEPEKRGR